MIVALWRWIARALFWLRYRVEIRGAEAAAARGTRGIVFVPNHPGLVDPVMLFAYLGRRFAPRALADSDQIDRFLIRDLARRIPVIEIPDLVKRGAVLRDEVETAVRETAKALRAGDNMLLYPSGHVYRSRLEDLRGNTALQTILCEAPDARVVLVRIRGLWGSGFTWAAGRAPSVAGNLRKGAWSILLSGLFFVPKRKVTIELYEPDDLPRTADRETLNQFIEAYYNEDAPPNTYVPYTPWEAGGRRELPDPVLAVSRGNVEAVPQAARQLVTEYLVEQTGQSKIADDDHLARDLGMDSLARADLIVWLEKEFGFPQDDVDAVETVADAMLGACGESIRAAVVELKPISAKWFRRPRRPQPPIIPDGGTIPEVFLKQALRNGSKAIVADQRIGVRTYRNLLTIIFAVKDRIAALGGERVGIMLPASAGADVTFLAALFAGKTPVMVNWTVGPRSVTHSLDLAGVRFVLTSKVLVDRLAQQGIDLTDVSDRFIFLEDWARELSAGRKFVAFLKARFRPRSLLKTDVPPTAVILSTSGSESLPKAVPLTHANLLANLRDVWQGIEVRAEDRLLSFLPPFHSFGLTVGVVLPLCAGVPVAYHPNPTEGPMLARLFEAYQASLLMGTPTFLGGMVRGATAGQMAGLRLAVTGGEKCPQRVYEALAQACPDALVLEGYGVTECSPIISVNDPDDPREGTIGKVLPAVQYAIVDVSEAGGDRAERRVEPGQAGMLLVRGPSVFDGYLNYDGPSPFVELDGRQWYRTGDLVSEDADGVLTFRGRLKRFVKLGGEMISLPAIEETLNRHYAGEADEGPVLAVEATPSEDHPELVLFAIGDLDRETVNSQIRQAGLSALHNIRRVIRIEEIPTLGTGKTDYRQLKTRLKEA